MSEVNMAEQIIRLKAEGFVCAAKSSDVYQAVGDKENNILAFNSLPCTLTMEKKVT